MELTERPYQYTYTKNEIRYVFTLDDLTRPGLFLQARIMFAKIGDEAFTELYTFEGLKPASDGKIYLYIQAYINALTSYVMPEDGAIYTGANDQCIRYYIEYREITDAIPNPDWNADELENERIGIKGGIERNKFSRNNIFVNYIETANPFLTWQPSGRFVFPNEFVYLSFLNRDRVGFKIMVKAYTFEGIENVCYFSYPDSTALLCHVLVSISVLDIETLIEAKVYYYDVSIVKHEDYSAIIAPYRLFVEYRPTYRTYDLVYHNSLSGIDAVRLTAETNISYDRAADELQQGLDIGEWNAPVKPHETSFANIAIGRKYKGNIGLMKTRTPEQQEAYLELLVSRSIYMKVNSWWIAVLNIQPTAEAGTRNSFKNGFELEFELSDKNEVFTPANKSFGIGTL